MADVVAPDPLAATARWTAGARAAETRRDDRLFADPWAAALAGPEGEQWAEARGAAATVPMVLRTRYFDDWLLAVAAEGIRQLVLPAAGLDTRAYRLAWPAETLLYEVDRPAVLADKARVLSGAGATSTARLAPVPADLTEDWPAALVAAGFDPDRPTAWLIEGLLFYLDRTAIDALLDAITRLSAPGSRLGFDTVNGAALTSPWTRAWIEMQAAAGAPWIGSIDDPAADLAARGWRAHLAQPGEPGIDHGRWTLPVVPAGRTDLPHTWYVTAERAG